MKYGYYTKLFMLCLLLLTLRWTGILRINVIFGQSMQPNYYQGDIVISSTLFNYDYGDVVVASANYGQGDVYIIKRIIAKPNDTIKRKGSYIYLNGEKLIEKYETIPEYVFADDWDFICEDNEYFLVGDNRINSWDSRSIGPVKDIKGKTFIHIPTGKLYQKILGAE